MVETASNIWRDEVSPGVPHKPIKAQIREWGADVEARIGAVEVGAGGVAGMAVYDLDTVEEINTYLGVAAAAATQVVSILDYIDTAEHASIAAHTSTFDCKADIEQAITALGSTGGSIYFPPGRYNISAKISIAANGITLIGAGRGFGTYGTVLRCTHATVGDILEVSGSNGGGITNMAFTCANGVTSGVAISLIGNCFEYSLENLAMARVFSGIDVSRATETRITRVHIREIFGTFGIRYGNPTSAGCYGLTLESVTTDNPIRAATYGTRRGNWATSTAYSLGDFAVANGHIYHCTTAGTSAGAGSGPSGFGSTPYDGTITDGTAVWKFYCSNALIWLVYDSFAYSLRIISCAFLNGAYGIFMRDTQNTGTSAPWWIHGFDVEVDHNYYYGVLLNNGEGFFITASWIGSCLTGSGVVYGAGWSGESVITATRIVGNWQHGVMISGGVSADISHNVIGANSQGGSGTYHGIAVSANVNEFTIIGNKVGDLHSLVEKQGYGILVNAGTSNKYIISGNRCHDNVTGTVSDGGTGVTKSVTGNI